MDVTVNRTKVSMIQGDITQQSTDVIVNAANPSLMGGGGVDGAIHRAGGPAILEACKEIVARQGRLPTSNAVITTGGNLKARYVIHTVGPIWHGGNGKEAELLKGAYDECLKLATENGLASIAFPSVSTGAYGYPINEAAKIAVSTVVLFLKERATSLKEVLFVLFDYRTYQTYCSALRIHLNRSEA